MCYQCYIDSGKPEVVNDRVKSAAAAITKLYEHPDCGVGGYAHIVVDDWNTEDGNIDYCLMEALGGKYDIDEEGRQLCIEVLNKLKPLTEDERITALAIHNKFIPCP